METLHVLDAYPKTKDQIHYHQFINCKIFLASNMSPGIKYTVYQSKTRRLCLIGYYSPHNNTRIKSKGCFEKFRKFSI